MDVFVVSVNALNSMFNGNTSNLLTTVFPTLEKATEAARKVTKEIDEDQNKKHKWMEYKDGKSQRVMITFNTTSMVVSVIRLTMEMDDT